MNEEARELAEKWGCTPSNTCYWYCVGAAQREIDDDEDILCRSLELGGGNLLAEPGVQNFSLSFSTLSKRVKFSSLDS